MELFTKNSKFVTYKIIKQMLTFDNKASLIKHLAPFRNQNSAIGFVPTMGAYMTDTYHYCVNPYKITK